MRVTFHFEFGLSSPPWMAYTFSKKMKTPLIRVLGSIIAVIMLSQCTLHRSSVYKAQMADLRSQVKVGQNIFDAEKRIRERYPHVTKPYYSTISRDELVMHVDFGLRTTQMEDFAYAFDSRLPFDKNERIVGIVVADATGTITSIE